MKLTANLLTLCFLFLFSSCSSLNTARKPANATSGITGVLELIQAPSRVYLSWDSPRAILKSYATSYIVRDLEARLLPLESRAMGHAMTHFKCQDLDGIDHEVWTGITGQHDPQVVKQMAFKEHAGFSMLFEAYDDGYMQSSQEVIDILARYTGRYERMVNGKKERLVPRFVRFHVNARQCSDLMAFYKTMATKQLGVPDLSELRSRNPEDRLYFGLTLDPVSLYDSYKNGATTGGQVHLGGGCTSMATSFLKIAGVYSPAFEEWKRTLLVSERFMKDYPISRFLTNAEATKWSVEGYADRSVIFYDPERMWDFLDGAVGCAQYERGIKDGASTVPGNCNTVRREWVSSLGQRIIPAKLVVSEVITDEKVTKKSARAKVRKIKEETRFLEFDGIEILP